MKIRLHQDFIDASGKIVAVTSSPYLYTEVRPVAGDYIVANEFDLDLHVNRVILMLDKGVIECAMKPRVLDLISPLDYLDRLEKRGWAVVLPEENE